MKGMLLFAHGARDRRWAASFEAVAERIRVQRPGLPVALAFLELMPPTLAEAADGLVARGCTRIDIVPMFLGAGGHVRQDLPALADAARRSHPGCDFVLHPPIGEIDAVVRAMAAAILDTVQAPAPDA